MSIKHLPLCACLALFLITVNYCAVMNAQTVEWKLKSGDQFDVNFHQESMVTSSFNLIQRKIGTRVVLDMEWQVKELDDQKIASIEQVISRIQMTMFVPLEGVQPAGKAGQVSEIAIDTSLDNADGKVAKDMLKQIKPLVGSTFSVKLAPNGEIVEVSASDETMQTLREIPGSMQLRQLLTPEGLQSVFGQSIVVLPKSDFEVDEEWTKNRSAATSLGNFAIRDTYSFQGESEFEGQKMLAIETTSSTTLEKANEEVAAELVGSSGKGVIYFNSDLGFFPASQYESTYSMRQPIRETEITTETTSSVKMRMTRKN